MVLDISANTLAACDCGSMSFQGTLKICEIFLFFFFFIFLGWTGRTLAESQCSRGRKFVWDKWFLLFLRFFTYGTQLYNCECRCSWGPIKYCEKSQLNDPDALAHDVSRFGIVFEKMTKTRINTPKFMMGHIPKDV